MQSFLIQEETIARERPFRNSHPQLTGQKQPYRYARTIDLGRMRPACQGRRHGPASPFRDTACEAHALVRAAGLKRGEAAARRPLRRRAMRKRALRRVAALRQEAAAGCRSLLGSSHSARRLSAETGSRTIFKFAPSASIDFRRQIVSLCIRFAYLL